MERKRFLSSMLAFAFAPATLKIQNEPGSKSDIKGFKVDSGE